MAEGRARQSPAAAAPEGRLDPGAGPRILFFSGGTALNGLCEELARYTRRSLHLVTPFDSGGSSARLREAFGIFAVGDTRNRLAALADPEREGNDRAVAFFRHRFSREAPAALLDRRLRDLIAGQDPLAAVLPSPQREVLLGHLAAFAARMPAGFDLSGASLGNLVLVGGLMAQSRAFDPLLVALGRLLGCRGRVWPTVQEDLHLAAELADGTVVVGQHRLTGKESPPLAQPIRRLHLSARLDRFVPARSALAPLMADRIARADLICYPMGSFYTSVVANLLPEGVGGAVAANPHLKIYIPNSGNDPEELGLDLAGAAAVLVETLRRDAPAGSRVLDAVLVDEARARRLSGAERARLDALGVALLARPLAAPATGPGLDPRLLADALAELARGSRP